MIDNISSKKMYNDENLREDCKAGAMMDVLLYWRSFNPEKYDNPFAYFTSIIINGMTKGVQCLYERCQVVRDDKLGQHPFAVN